MITMPYNTRRKSLSLPSLGIQLPSSSRAHRSNSKSNSPPLEVPLRPAKRVKRSHDDAKLSTSASQSGTTQRSAATEHTPPPSPGRHSSRKVDTQGINDDIVIAVIEQLEKTGNRPHLIKDLATVLASCNQNIAQSANAPALLSMRLSQYLKRQWTALSPCPLAKDTIPVHPRRIFFYLTTMPRAALPDNSDDIIPPELKRLTPSISDPSVEEEEDHDRGRMSPSPEVDLYAPELDRQSSMPPTPGESFSGRSSLNPDGMLESHSHGPNRAPSLPLEADERGFTETATAVRARGMSLRDLTVQQSIEEMKKDDLSPELRQRKDQEELFGHLQLGVHGHDQRLSASSPMIRANVKPSKGLQIDTLMIDDIEAGLAGWSLMSPEKMDLEELEDLFEDY